MNKKKILGVALIVLIFIGLAATIVYIFTELKDETEIQIQNVEFTDAKKFKNEYEALNDKEEKEGQNYRTVSISENNPIKYAKASDIISKIDNKETFLVYFGYDTCPWCRLVIEALLNTASNYNINTIYYVDVKNIRDVYSLNEKHELVRTTEGTDGYYALINKLAPVLDNYEPLTYEVKDKKKKTKTVTVEIDEKRIYTPSVVLVKNGVPTLRTTGISKDIKDPYVELTEDMQIYAKEEFGKLFNEVNPTTTTTTGEVCTGIGNC